MAGPLLISICLAALSHAQEQTPSNAAGSPAASASKPAVLSSTATPTPSATPRRLSDVLFKNLKACSIGAAVMGGDVSDTAIDPVGLAEGITPG